MLGAALRACQVLVCRAQGPADNSEAQAMCESSQLSQCAADPTPGRPPLALPAPLLRRETGLTHPTGEVLGLPARDDQCLHTHRKQVAVAVP